MRNNNLRYIISILLAVLVVFSLAACGSGGGGGGSSADNKNGSGGNGGGTVSASVVSGVAATGEPVTGNVYLKDSNGIEQGPVVIAPDGSYSFNVEGLTAPFYLKAVNTNTGEAIYSVSPGMGTANINPLTNLAVAVAAGVNDPAAAYNDPFSHPVSQSGLENAVADIRTMLAPLLNNANFNADINFLTDAFIADHTGLDKVFDEMRVEQDSVSGTVKFVLRGIEIGQAYIGNFSVIEAVTETKIQVAIYGASASGTGSTCPFPATLSLNVSDIGEGSLSYDFQDTFFEATSINEPVTSYGYAANELTANSVIIIKTEPSVTATITGTGTLNGEPGHSFKATVRNYGFMGMEIDGVAVPVPGAGPLRLIRGGFTARGTVSGIGQTCPFPASMSLSVNSSTLETSWLKYDFEDTFLEATSIANLIVDGGTATITGTGNLNGTPGHTFTATIKDGSLDEMSIDIEGIPFPAAGTLPLTGGTGFTVQ